MDTKKLRQKILDLAIHGKLVPPVCRQAGKTLTMNPEPPIKGKKCWFTYVIECEDGSFYKGYTDNLLRRYKQHCDGNGAEYTKKHKPKQLYYWEMHYTQENALNREKYLKSGIGREWFKREVVDKPENFEPASVLLERIRAEKERLVKEGKIKKSKASKTSDTPHYENVPFEVPDGWCWCKLDDLAFYKKGPFGSSLTKSMFVPDSPSAYKVYEQKNAINKDATLGHYFIDKTKFEELKGFAVQPEDIIVSCAGTIGETYVLPQNIREGIINQALMTIRLFDKSISDFYLLYFDFILKNEAANESKGTAIKNIPPFDILKNFFFPLPPLEEQNRIIEKVSYWLSFVNAIDSEGKEMGNLISKTKSKILDLAIHGKLVPQDPNDESASELLKRINPKAEITCDNGQYGKIPSGWCMCKLEELCKIKGGKRIPRGMSFSNNKTPYVYLRVTDMKSNTIQLDDLKYIDQEVFEQIKNYTINSTDLYLTIAGTIGSVGIIPEVVNGMNLTENAAKLTSIACNKEYLLYALQSSIAQDHFTSRFHQVAQPKLSIETANKTPVPLPPLSEQHRIVAKIEELFNQLDQIQKSLEA